MRLPWRSSSGPVRRSPAVEIPVLSRLKRRREDEEEAEQEQGHTVKRARPSPWREQSASGTIDGDDVDAISVDSHRRQQGQTPDDVEVSSKPQPRSAAETSDHPAETETQIEDTTGPNSSSLTPLQRTIEAQFSLEILLKHQELRLIEEELAKCEIAYEQLRRCERFPFSTADVTNGPYTRHYARWLIPDPAVDEPKIEPQVPPSKVIPAGKGLPEGRTTRSNVTEAGPGAGEGRRRTFSSAAKKQAPSTGGLASKNKTVTLIVKRSSDGRLVKLNCLDCGRGNFSSAQGFINHCRIAHQRGFDSHDAAAVACGEPVESDEMGNDGPGASASLVNPLVRSAPISRRATSPLKVEPTRCSGMAFKARSTGSSAVDNFHASARPRRQPSVHAQAHNGAQPSVPTQESGSTAFVPSSQVPRLSALLARERVGVDLGSMVDEVNQRFEFSPGPSSDDEEDDENAEEDQDEDAQGTLSAQQRRPTSARGNHEADLNLGEHSTTSSHAPTHVPARTSSASLCRPSGTKGQGNGAKRSTPISIALNSSLAAANLATAASRLAADARPCPPHLVPDSVITSPPSPGLSPNTVDLNTAPSLVSDDDEYEAHSESESPSSDAIEEDDDELEVEVDDGREDESTTDPCLTSVGRAKGGVSSRRAAPPSSRGSRSTDHHHHHPPELVSRGRNTRQRRGGGGGRHVTSSVRTSTAAATTDTNHSGRTRSGKARRPYRR